MPKEYIDKFLSTKKFLCLDYSLGTMSVAIFDGKKLLGKTKKNNAAFGNYSLIDLISRLLNKLKIDKQIIDLIIATNGPGSFTAIRVLIGCAYGLEQGLGCKLFGIGTLPVLAFCANNQQNKRRVVITKAYQNQVYLGAFRFTQQKINTDFAPLACDKNKILDYVKQDDIVYDPENMLSQFAELKKFNIIKKSATLNLAEKIGRLCLSNDFLKIADTKLKPDYIKIPQAEEKFFQNQKIKKLKWNQQNK